MAYRINDLMINVASVSEDDAGEVAAECPGETCFLCSTTPRKPGRQGCDGLISAGCRITPNVTTVLLYAIDEVCNEQPKPSLQVGPQRSAVTREQLSMLKTQLKQALAEIEREESALAKVAEPETIEEVEELEEKLRDALVTLNKRKTQIVRKTSGRRKTRQTAKTTRKRK